MALPDDRVVAVAVVIGIGLALVLLGWATTRAILAAANREPRAMVTVALAVVTLAALGAFVLTGREVLATIAATGVGALASAVTGIFERHKKDETDTIGGTGPPPEEEP